MIICCSKVTVSVRYADLLSVLPTRIRVLAWPIQHSKNNSTDTPSKNVPARLSYAEDALRTMSLPEGIFFLMTKKMVTLDMLSNLCTCSCRLYNRAVQDLNARYMTNHLPILVWCVLLVTNHFQFKYLQLPPLQLDSTELKCLTHN